MKMNPTVKLVLTIGLILLAHVAFDKLVPNPRPIDYIVYALIVIGGPIASAYLDGIDRKRNDSKVPE